MCKFCGTVGEDLEILEAPVLVIIFKQVQEALIREFAGKALTLDDLGKVEALANSVIAEQLGDKLLVHDGARNMIAFISNKECLQHLDLVQGEECFIASDFKFVVCKEAHSPESLENGVLYIDKHMQHVGHIDSALAVLDYAQPKPVIWLANRK